MATWSLCYRILSLFAAGCEHRGGASCCGGGRGKQRGRKIIQSPRFKVLGFRVLGFKGFRIWGSLQGILGTHPNVEPSGNEGKQE